MNSHLYNDKFYLEQRQSSYNAAVKFIGRIAEFFIPDSVVDIGCGVGNWLDACSELGVKDLLGVDGHWVKEEFKVKEQMQFICVDLEYGVPEINKRFDLAICVEVLEHISDLAGEKVLDFLVKSSDVILFSSAFKSQGGVHHINEQLHSYWAEKFAKKGFIPFDLFRPILSGDPDIPFWYQQNSFLYCRSGSLAWQMLLKSGQSPISNFAYMDMVHPALFKRQVEENRNVPIRRLFSELFLKIIKKLNLFNK